ncbi:lytic transglycosylase [Salmonella enterica]|uniref:Lytic transglycosylase n=3 Tax=Salmonella enterica TaxID=28901 RepID=A0A5W1A1Y6_SALET|nr:lytic transglycosylase [Salmonella enterica]EBW0110967.1 lytic transglycosylase [Salmonella enterica subsp. enterica serovar Bareilly]ECK9413512.1 lytic transglycosylase [Salmonella enterica subsp. enterica serovar Typhisuis str. CFSAN000655]ECU7962388.1 lytic transglycosylase [Salmonella enterica subsp. enterica serovar Newport]HAE6955665.1 lytic transglycosylase [Salmonella enterica subsp. enterica serovar Typhisuis]HBL7092790.1 lytic transglycosylase [Salmonella enterica subsp. enterica 
MNAETIKDFLVSLGFDIDEAGYEKFESVLAGVTANAIKTGLAVEGAALSVVAFTAKIASGLDNLYWASQRTGATVQGIQSIGYAVSQVGGSVDAARTSLESLSRFVRNNPGAEGFLNRLGVQTRDASGNMRDMAAIFTGVGQKLSSMPYYRANQYAQMLGIDENTLMAMRRGVGSFSGQYSAMAKAIGFNADEAARSSNKFMTSLREFGTMAGMARDKIGSNLAGGLAGSLDMLRRHILDNFPRIEQTLTKAIKGILTLGDIIGRLFFRLIEGTSSLITWWQSLDKQTRELISLFGALTIALRILNSTFWMSPIGLITALAAGIALLWEDYQTWKEGGDSLIDWGKWKPEVDAALKMVRDLKTTVNDLAKALAKLLNIDPKSWSLKWDFSNFIDQMGEFSKMLNMIADLLNAIKDGRWADAASIGKRMLNQGSENPSAMPMVTDSANSVAEWIKDKTGWDPRSVGQTIRGIGEGEPEQHAQAAKRGERNNNPGNLNFAGQAGATLERPGGRFARFETAFDGLRALSRQLVLYAGRGINSVEKIISTWAPASDNNNTAAYIQAVSQRLGVNPQAALNINDPQTMSALMSSIIHHENGRNIYSKELIGKAAVAGIGGANVNQQNTYHIYGGGDPRSVGTEVERRQQSANAQVMRGNQTKVG